MVAARDDLQPLLVSGADHAIHQPVIPGNASRPPALKLPAQRLRLACPAKRVALCIPDQLIDAAQDGTVLFLLK